MTDQNTENDYVNEAIRMEDGNAIDTKKISKNNTAATYTGKAHISLVAIVLIFIVAVFTNLGVEILLGEISIIFGIIMGVIAVITYPSLSDNGYSVSKNVYIFIFSFMIGLSYLIGIILGGVIGLIIMAVILYWILSNNNLIG